MTSRVLTYEQIRSILGEEAANELFCSVAANGGDVAYAEISEPDQIVIDNMAMEL